VRYFPLLQALQIPFAFATHPSLVPLFQQWGPPGITVLDETKLAPPWTQAPHLALLSLPRLLRSDLASIPMATPYLTPPGPPPERLLVPPPPGGLAIGLVWASKIITDPFHDIMLYHKAPLALLRGELIDPMTHARHR
jgi:hypothetical protein